VSGFEEEEEEEEEEEMVKGVLSVCENIRV
jgi:hypothetical protein